MKPAPFDYYAPTSVGAATVAKNTCLWWSCFSVGWFFPILLMEALSPAAASTASRAARLACASTDGHVCHG